MIKTPFALRPLFLCTFFGAALLLSGCDFGNKTNDTDHSGSDGGTIQQGDNADDDKVDTTEVGSFQK